VCGWLAIAELRSALFLLWVESSLFCFKPRNQFPDPIERLDPGLTQLPSRMGISRADKSI